jgi:hypothetical protein
MRNASSVSGRPVNGMLLASERGADGSLIGLDVPVIAKRGNELPSNVTLLDIERLRFKGMQSK